MSTSHTDAPAPRSGRGRSSSTRSGTPRLSPALAAQDRRRRRRRHLLLWGTLPVWATVLVLGFLLMINVGVNRAAIDQFEDEEYRSAVDDFEYLDAFNLVERWKAPFNLGTARYANDNLWGAIEDLDHALRLVPDEHRCMVQTNRALVFEAWGDEEMEWSVESAGWADEAQALVDAGTPYPDDAPWGDATPEELRDDVRMYAGWAADDYALATEARQDPTCSDDSQASADQQEQNQQSQQRLEDKESEAAEAAQDPAEEQQPTPSSPEQEEQQRQEELDQRTAEAQAQADAERQAQADAENEAAAGGSGDQTEDDGSGAGDDTGGDGDAEGYGGGTKNW
jgi:hypothetical protein